MAAALLARGAAILRSRSVFAAGAAASLVASWLLLRGSLGRAVAQLAHARPLSLVIASACLVAMIAASALGWRSALRSSGAVLGVRHAVACYGIGSLANTVLPAKIGEGVRVGLFARRLPEPNRARLAATTWMHVAASRAAATAAVLAVGTGVAGLPAWAPELPALGAIALAVGARAFGRLPPPRRLAVPATWLLVASSARLAALVAVLQALSVADPLGPAFVSLAALGVASSLPLAPGSAGLAAVAMAVSVRHTGVDPGTAAAAAIAFHALETLASVGFGAAGAVALARGGRYSGSTRAA